MQPRSLKRLAVPFATNLANWKSQVSKKDTEVATMRFSVLSLQLSFLPKLKNSISTTKGRKKKNQNN